MTKGALEKIRDKLIASVPLHRLGDGEDLKGVAALLASDASRHITGQIIAVDGGPVSPEGTPSPPHQDPLHRAPRRADGRGD